MRFSFHTANMNDPFYKNSRFLSLNINKHTLKISMFYFTDLCFPCPRNMFQKETNFVGKHLLSVGIS